MANNSIVVSSAFPESNAGVCVDSAFIDYYRCPLSVSAFEVNGTPSPETGFFRFGENTVCFGRLTSGAPSPCVTDPLHDAMSHVTAGPDRVRLPFQPSDVIANLRYERYVGRRDRNNLGIVSARVMHSAYYRLRPLFPVWVRRHLQRIRLRGWKDIPFPLWPAHGMVEHIIETLMELRLKSGETSRIPFIWFWPNGAPTCTMMTHDIETSTGRDFCPALMDLDDAYGIKSSFQVIPEHRYEVAESFLREIRARGFEINVHDLNHDGRLFENRDQFLARVERINRYAGQFGAEGFRSGVLYRNLDWYGALKFAYDMSVPSVGHLEAQRGGCCAVTPFFIGRLLELPVTATQDYTLFHILNDYSIELWKRQIGLIAQRHGLASFIVHPDYVRDARARRTYAALLAHIVDLREKGETWTALPGEVNRWWRARHKMQLVQRNGAMVIEGPQSHRARVAYAVLDGGRLVYEL